MKDAVKYIILLVVGPFCVGMLIGTIASKVSGKDSLEIAQEKATQAAVIAPISEEEIPSIKRHPQLRQREVKPKFQSESDINDLVKALSTPGQSPLPLVAKVLANNGFNVSEENMFTIIDVDAQHPHCSDFELRIAWVKGKTLDVELWYDSIGTYEAEDALDEAQKIGLYPGYAFILDKAEDCIAFYGVSSRSGTSTLVELEHLRLENIDFDSTQNHFMALNSEYLQKITLPKSEYVTE